MEKVNLAKNYKSQNRSVTSMVSLIIPGNTNLGDLRQSMKKEYQTASNIKSSSNRKSVQTALSKIGEYLRGIKELPHTGIGIFSEQYI